MPKTTHLMQCCIPEDLNSYGYGYQIYRSCTIAGFGISGDGYYGKRL
jgi:hypothetical protein